MSFPLIVFPSPLPQQFVPGDGLPRLDPFLVRREIGDRTSPESGTDHPSPMAMKDRVVGWILSLLEKQGNPGVLLWAIGLIRQLYRNQPGAYGDLLLEQAGREHWLPRFFAAHEAHVVYDNRPEDIREVLENLSASDHEMVREGAARSWGELLGEDFETVFPILQGFASDPRFELRYTAALAPVRPCREGRLTESQRDRIRRFWESFENDPRQGLWNLVRQQILERVEPGSDGPFGPHPVV